MQHDVITIQLALELSNLIKQNTNIDNIKKILMNDFSVLFEILEIWDNFEEFEPIQKIQKCLTTMDMLKLKLEKVYNL